MSKNSQVIDFEARKGKFEQQRKEAKVEALRDAFRQARGEEKPSSKTTKNRKRRGKS